MDEPVAEEEIATGVLDILPNGSGFVRVDPAVHSRDDVYVSPAQIRRCELRSGDELSGPVRPARRNERHPSLIHVETVNGGPAEPPAERPAFDDLTAVFATERLPAPPAIGSVPFGRGSRVAIAGPPGAGASTLLREIVAALSEGGPEVPVQVALAGARPEEVAEWSASGAEVVGGSFDRSPEAQAQAAELAVERAKRRVERGAHAVVAVDSLDVLPQAARRRVFGAGRNTEEGGSLTVIAVTGDGSEALRWATTRIVLESAGPDAPGSAGVRRQRHPARRPALASGARARQELGDRHPRSPPGARAKKRCPLPSITRRRASGMPSASGLLLARRDHLVLVAGQHQRGRRDVAEPVQGVVPEHGLDLPGIALGILGVARLLLDEAREHRRVGAGAEGEGRQGAHALAPVVGLHGEGPGRLAGWRSAWAMPAWVHPSTSRRTRPGWRRASSWAIIPPIEMPNTSARSTPGGRAARRRRRP